MPRTEATELSKSQIPHAPTGAELHIGHTPHVPNFTASGTRNIICSYHTRVILPFVWIVIRVR